MSVLQGPFDTSGLHAVNRLPISSLRRDADPVLDEGWQFQLRPSAAAADGTPWEPVTVPDLWTMRGAGGEHPHYTNVPMPFPEAFPDLPTSNPMGVYRRDIEVEGLGDQRLILRVGAAEGFLRVAVNGVNVGTSGDSHLEAEFDLTEHVVPGANVLELAVSKWSAASYLEDQDQWWQFGVSRPVSLHRVPRIRLHDAVVVSDYDSETRRGRLSVTVQTTGLRGREEPGYRARVAVLGGEHLVPVAARMPTQTLPKPSRDRRVRPPQRMPDDFMDSLSMAAAGAELPPEFRANPDAMWWVTPQLTAPGEAELELEDLDVPPWSAESPHLEDLLVELLDPDGRVVDAARWRIGFRRVRIAGRDLLVNGARILVQGVNRHDIDPTTGRIMSRERMLAELSLLKRSNVNAIRASHYPNSPEFLDLCDEIGFYVIDEADVESHAFASTLVHDPLYLTEIIERVARMVLRDRTHPCVILWSLGNESGYGPAHDAAAAWVRGTDPTRPVQYEGAVASDWYGGRAASDVVCPMYPSFASLRAYATDDRADRPLITCEYAYSQGNSTGGFAEYWELFETLPGLQGGFIWEFLEHALDPDGDGRSLYGGDFGDEPNNGATMLNGLVASDLTPKPALHEVRAVFAPLRFAASPEELHAGRIRVWNRQSFADAGALTVHLRVERSDGGSGEETMLDLPPLPAGSEARLPLPEVVLAAIHDPAALALTAIVRTGTGSLWAPEGTELALDQIVLRRPSTVLPRGIGPAVVDERGDIVDPLLRSGPRLELWRALTDNDLSAALDQRFVRSGFFCLDPIETVVSPGEEATEVSIVYRAAFGARVEHRRRISRTEDGYLFDEDVRFAKGTHDHLRVGVVFELREGFDHAEWTGFGPWENYTDRRSGALLGRWSAPIDDLAVPYLRPQENGTRSGVVDLTMTGGRGVATLSSAAPLHVNASRYSVDELESVDHWWELPVREGTVVHVDVAHRGMGTGRIGPDTTAQHRLVESRYRWQWHLLLAVGDE
ncbi:glycoside hydrolase family 2 (plasmid) [Rathayibacter sp. VKM Ac-2803]|uniref:beta-galactosidase n=1 Tax=Rathayibacter caricis DSM 15933 TaxID=1328867 RepID=A0A2T4UNT1_9MICO|nr:MULTISPECIES: glycoside hydrolase family 2 TIM barrel-domain containing protein [Rathayibacter]MWV51566.1 glycoside hydrolase family 2 [Rathayibacter sp. VKM Ac-2803]PTL71167.1 glycoside hydrolase family 2 [Rathayibacter caricis DSM 15933]